MAMLTVDATDSSVFTMVKEPYILILGSSKLNSTINNMQIIK